MLKGKGSFLDLDFWERTSSQDSPFYFRESISYRRVTAIEVLCNKILKNPENDSFKNDLYQMLKKEGLITAWDLITWGERNYFSLEKDVESRLLALGEDNYYRSFMMASFGTILSILHGADDEKYLKSLFNTPFVVDSLFFNNSSHRQKQIKRPSVTLANNSGGSDLISLCKKIFPMVKHLAIFSYAEKMAVKYLATDDEDHMDSLASTEVIFHKLEKLTPTLIRFFNSSQWDFYKSRMLTSQFFQLSNKSFFRGVG